MPPVHTRSKRRLAWRAPARLLPLLVLGLCAACLAVHAQDGSPAEPKPAAPTPPPTAAARPASLEVQPTDDPALLILKGAKLKAPKTGNGARRPSHPVVDGDTMKVEGIPRSLRLILIDTEEVAHADTSAEDKDLMQRDFAAYQKKMKARDTLPVKYATPLGDEATRFATAFCKDASSLRLERDTPDQRTGTFGRTLCYVWAEYQNGQPPKLYNLEAVRQGMSPYYVKYGRSHRFDAAFRAAEAEARKAGRGIWDPTKKHYDDYEVRLAWWGRRAEALDRYAQLRKAHPLKAPIFVQDRNAIRRLLRRVGKEVTVFGLIDDHEPTAVRFHEDGATLRIGGRYAIEVEIVGTKLAASMDLRSLRGEFIQVRGPLDRKGSPLGGRSKNNYMRIPVTDPTQLVRGERMQVGS